MRDITKKVVILDKLSSPYVREAIIVLKDCAVPSEKSVIAEAERIVNNYFEKNNGRTLSSDRGKNKILKLCLAVCLTAIAVLGCKVITA